MVRALTCLDAVALPAGECTSPLTEEASMAYSPSEPENEAFTLPLAASNFASVAATPAARMSPLPMRASRVAVLTPRSSCPPLVVSSFTISVASTSENSMLPLIVVALRYAHWTRCTCTLPLAAFVTISSAARRESEMLPLAVFAVTEPNLSRSAASTLPPMRSMSSVPV